VVVLAGPQYAKARDQQLGRIYTGLAWYLMTLYCIYPIVWGLAEGANVINATASVSANKVL
jgi:bacteriorhodopsin